MIKYIHYIDLNSIVEGSLVLIFTIRLYNYYVISYTKLI